MTPRCDKHHCKLVKKRHGPKVIWSCPFSHTPIPKAYIPAPEKCQNCGKELATPFQHFRGCM